MKIGDQVFEKNYQVGEKGEPILFDLLRIMEDAAGKHANTLGFGYNRSLEKGFFWVLVRQKLKMYKWPIGSDQVKIKTWSRPIAGMNAVREFELFHHGQKIGECSTTWVILDTQSRRPKKIDNTDQLFRPRLDYNLGITAEKIKVPDDLQALDVIQVSQEDLDSNDHVNNLSYTKWILISLSKGFNLQMIHIYEINFLGETFIGENLEILSDLPTYKNTAKEHIHFRIDRKRDSKAVCCVRISDGAI